MTEDLRQETIEKLEALVTTGTWPNLVNHFKSGKLLICKEEISLVEVGSLLVLDLDKEIIKLTGTDQKIIYKDLPVNDPMQRQPDIDKARSILGWEPKITFQEMVHEMMENDINIAKRDSLVKEHGFKAPNFNE